ncbi:hypothetical protein [Halorhabdus amylolytica]|uniref:hypothetical protein n=1 Tax=Halorhabdus amylolytica TaxID=2559573 RepID=UPI0010AA1A85|nr:hypothetical protein [Halorhabdus amylolytica]
MSVNSRLSKIEVGDSVEVVLHRYSDNSQHFISYPTDTDYDGTEDGIHIEVPQALTEDLIQIVSNNQTTLRGETKITEAKTQGYPLGELSSIDEVICRENIDSAEDINGVIETVKNSSQISTTGFINISIPISAENDRKADSRREKSKQTQKNKENNGSNGSKKSRPPEKIREPDPPPDVVGNDKMQVYYVDSSKAECYHSFKNCEGLKHRKGILKTVGMDTSKPKPEEIADLLECRRCL